MFLAWVFAKTFGFAEEKEKALLHLAVNLLNLTELPEKETD